MNANKILLIGAENSTNKTLSSFLDERGYASKIIFSVKDIVAEVRLFKPDIIIVDRPNDSDSFAAIMSSLINEKDVRFIPKMLMLLHEDMIPALRQYEDAIDDYIEKPLDYKILLSRIKVIEKWLSFVRGHSPITGLPGKRGIAEAVRKAVKAGDFSFLYYQINDFDAFNNKYGYFEGDRVLTYLVKLVRQAHKRYSETTDFIGHLDGDAVVSLSPLTAATEISKYVTTEFDNTSQGFYTATDRKQGHIAARENGEMKRFNFMTLSVLVAGTEKRKYHSLDDVMKIITQLKKVERKGNYSVSVIDRRGDKGTKFTVTKAQTERRTLIGENAVLIVDKDATARAMITTYLEMQGLAVSSAGTINEAFALAYDKKFDLIITDVELPDGNGLEFVTRLKSIASLKTTPVMFLSSFANKELVIQAIRSGASRYLIKPINNPELFRNVYEILVSK
ncbi:MAG: response regulator [Spirochaetes bacterium]|nr:response regulator [Spirochaetota bacterium]